MIRRIVGDKPHQWDTLLAQLKFDFNSVVNRSIGKSPFSIVFTKVPNYTLDLLSLPSFKSQVADKLAEAIVQTYSEVTQELDVSNACYKRPVDQHRRLKTFAEGDLVMVHLEKQCFPVGAYNKLQPKKLGPFWVLKKINDNVYLLDLPPDLQISPTFNIANIYEYFPPDKAIIFQEHSGSSSSKDGGIDVGA